MEQMKISSIIKAYPNSFVVGQAVKRYKSGGVELATVLTVSPTKDEAVVNQKVFDLLGIATFMLPTMDTEDALRIIEMPDGSMISEPLMTAEDYAKMFREFYGW